MGVFQSHHRHVKRISYRTVNPDSKEDDHAGYPDRECRKSNPNAIGNGIAYLKPQLLNFFAIKSFTNWLKTRSRIYSTYHNNNLNFDTHIYYIKNTPSKQWTN